MLNYTPKTIPKSLRTEIIDFFKKSKHNSTNNIMAEFNISRGTADRVINEYLNYKTIKNGKNRQSTRA